MPSQIKGVLENLKLLIQDNKEAVRSLEELERLVALERTAYRQTWSDRIDWSTPGVTQALRGDGAFFTARWDPMGRLLVKRNSENPHLPRVGDVLSVGESRRRARLKIVEPLYLGDAVEAALCTLEC